MVLKQSNVDVSVKVGMNLFLDFQDILYPIWKIVRIEPEKNRIIIQWLIGPHKGLRGLEREQSCAIDFGPAGTYTVKLTDFDVEYETAFFHSDFTPPAN